MIASATICCSVTQTSRRSENELSRALATLPITMSSAESTPFFSASRPTKGLAWLLLWFGMVTINAEQHVASLNVTAMQQLLIRNDKAVLMLYAGACSRAKEFVPVLEDIATRVPELAFGRFDVTSDQKVGMVFKAGIEPEAPALKAFFKNAPPEKRVLVYRGRPTMEDVLPWAQAVATWNGTDELPSGWKVGTKEREEALAKAAADELANVMKEGNKAKMKGKHSRRSKGPRKGVPKDEMR